MDILKTPLTILFKDQNPYRILYNYFKCNSYNDCNYKKIDKNMFVKLYQEKEPQVSKDECINSYYIVAEKMQENIKGIENENSVFNLLANYEDTVLDDCGNTVRCKYKDLLKWRSVTLNLDSDMFICSFLAYKDILGGRERHSFNWDTIIKSNNIRLHNMLSKGMAENHFHLNGSAPTFKLSWISLMNDVHAKDVSPIDMDKNRLGKDLDGKVDIKDLIMAASLIRIILFNELKREDLRDNINDKFLRLLMEIIDNDYIDSGIINKDIINMYSYDIQKEIDGLKFIYGSKINYKNKEQYIDYALTSDVNKASKGTRLFLGERYFMYSCFKRIYRNKKDDNFKKYIDLFYAYLIIKNKVREELIQQNNKVGFSNFGDYQDRKTKYLRRGSILKEAVEPSAILTSIKTQNIKSLEVRVVPDFTAFENADYISKQDNIICNQVINDDNNFWLSEEIKNFKEELYDEIKDIDELSLLEKQIIFNDNKRVSRINEKLKNKYFYVYHFPKSKDVAEDKDEEYFSLYLRCRHYEYRKKVKAWAMAIFNMRENNQISAERVLGIDACANELSTRPEVFGQAFRFLKNHLPSQDYLCNYLGRASLQRLRATYHVGEDFLDVIDGLRAIDEVITFLEFTHGDRLGHAIALGIDVKEWYSNKLNRVYLSKQDILDNIAWLIKKIKEYDIEVGHDTIDKLVGIYTKYYTEIYIRKINNYSIETKDDEDLSAKSVVPVDAYISAWELRGDDPEIYDGINNNEYITYWERCAVRKKEKSRLVCELYNRYHYDPYVKCEGYKKDVFKIEPYIIDAAVKIQKRMQIEIRKRGIGIETNPSSNVLISTFKRYDKHPILNMNNAALKIDKEAPQLFVSINTDDQGVFDTLLENEYALMGIALEKVKDEYGNCVYNQDNIYEWLDKIRAMGIEQSFRIPRE